MIEKMREMLKGKKKLSPEEIHAKKSVVGHIKSAAEDMMKEPLGKLNKVTVAADNPKDLTHGLDKAKELMAHMPTDMQEGSAEEESKESPEEEAAEMESPEEEATEGAEGESEESMLKETEMDIEKMSDKDLEELQKMIEKKLGKKTLMSY